MNEYLAQPMSTLWMLVFGIGFISTAIFLLLFAHCIRLIERRIRRDGREGSRPLDFGGSKIVTYAYAIVLPEHGALRIERLIDVRLVRRYANKVDRWRVTCGYYLFYCVPSENKVKRFNRFLNFSLIQSYANRGWFGNL
jgi:hypothetical protein